MWLALDAEFYLAFDAGREDCIDAVERCGHAGKLLLPTAYQEIADLIVSTTDSELRTHAADALRFMAANDVLAAPAPRENVGTDDGLAQEIIRSGLLSEEDRNQALLLAEAACQQIAVLFTLDPVILAVDKKRLSEMIKGRHLSPFKIETVSL